MDKATLASMIDSTLLRSEATKEDIVELCKEAAVYHFASVCINPFYVPMAKELLKGTGVKVCTVIGFPMGAITAEMKAAEAKLAVEAGADEIDMVAAIPAERDNDWDYVEKDIAGVVKAAGSVPVKVIIETCLLTTVQMAIVARIAKDCGAAFVKTSTGFSVKGAYGPDVKQLKRIVGDTMGIKASGGIGDLDKALEMIECGATRLGTSHAAKIIDECEE